MTPRRRSAHRRSIDRYRPVLTFLAYLLLVALSSAAVYRVETGRKEAERTIAAAVKDDRVNTCLRGNELRMTLRQILDGTLTPADVTSRQERRQIERQRDFVRAADERLRDRDCAAVAREPFPLK